MRYFTQATDKREETLLSPPSAAGDNKRYAGTGNSFATKQQTSVKAHSSEICRVNVIDLYSIFNFSQGEC